jgi:hypothetical protein
MKKNVLLLLAACTTIGSHAQTNNRSAGADMIVHHAKATTPAAAQPQAPALAVKAGGIYAESKDNQIVVFKDGHTSDSRRWRRPYSRTGE